ncbi:MAG: hypothetical protein HQL13_05180 [Candidatus Omnitrophica bacterium]|nr:hypothetical protein [Candidatus Omnitrophota bacterium]
MIGLCKKIIRIFGKEDRAKFIILCLSMLLNSAMEIIGIGLILPFILLLGRPSLVTTNKWVSFAYHAGHFQSFNQFMAALSALIAVSFILKNAVLFFVLYWQTYFVFQKQAYLVSRLFRAYLVSPYSFHLKRNVGRLKHVISSVGNIMKGVVLQIFNIMTELMLVMCLFICLMVAYPLLTLSMMVCLAGALLVFFLLLKRKLRECGEIAHQHAVFRSQAIERP